MNRMRIKKIILLQLTIFVLMFFSACMLQENRIKQTEKILLPQNYAEAEIKNVKLDLTESTVFLQKKNSNLTLEFYVSRGQGELILAALHNSSLPRPMMHDLFFKILKETEMKLLYVSVDKLEGGTYYASILIETGNGDKIKLDARPSDALIIALKSNVPIYLEEGLLSAAGEIKESKGDILRGREV